MASPCVLSACRLSSFPGRAELTDSAGFPLYTLLRAADSTLSSGSAQTAQPAPSVRLPLRGAWRTESTCAILQSVMSLSFGRNTGHSCKTRILPALTLVCPLQLMDPCDDLWSQLRSLTQLQGSLSCTRAWHVALLNGGYFIAQV